MPGSLVDLSNSTIRLPPRLVLDSNVVIDWLVFAFLLAPTSRSTSVGQDRASLLVERLSAEQSTGFITSTSATEIFHYLIKVGYRTRLPDHRADLLRRYPNVRRYGWEHLFKARSDLIRQIAGVMDDARRAMAANGLLFLQPEELGPIRSGNALDAELVATMARYELDSNDAAILVEARRAGVDVIASSDPDLRRAAIDFDVYSWL